MADALKEYINKNEQHEQKLSYIQQIFSKVRKSSKEHSAGRSGEKTASTTKSRRDINTQHSRKTTLNPNPGQPLYKSNSRGANRQVPVAAQIVKPLP